MPRNVTSPSRMLGIVLLALFAAVCCGAQAQVPDKLAYQGYLTDSGGTPITGSRSMMFTLYNAGGTSVYSETQTVNVANGTFNVAIGSVTAMNLPFDVPYFLGIKVGTDAEMTPRQALLSSPYAQRADTANLLAATATVPTTQLTGTIATAQIANGAVTQSKLSAGGGTAGKVLGTDGTNLLWQAGGAGTVTSVGTGAGLSGGPITAAGTINLAASQLLPTTVCATNQIAKWNGSAWACAADNDTISGGTVTAVTAGTGLTGGTITSTGTIAVATPYKLPQSCTSGQLPQSDGAGNWLCVTPLPGVGGNVDLVDSTATTGNIVKAGFRFIHNFGTNNTFIGSNAGNFTMSGTNNSGDGTGALFSNTTGSNNTASGVYALLNNTTGIQNTADGVNALFSNTTGFSNTALGVNALSLNSNGSQNTATGTDALYSNSTGKDNTAVGMNALFANTTGSNNVAIGSGTLQQASSGGSDNTAVGMHSLFNSASGSRNTAIGSGALQLYSGDNNTAVGYRALGATTAGANSAFGFFALGSNTQGYYNTATGNQALNFNTTGIQNTANGANALQNNTVGHDNSAVGFGALLTNSTGYENVAVGSGSLSNNDTGFGNVAVGAGALGANVTGSGNVGVGINALSSNTIGQNNSALGPGALEYNKGGQDNTALGSTALQGNLSGNSNTAAGSFSLWANLSGYENAAFGAHALEQNQAERNTAVGFNALQLNSGGYQNTAVGYGVLAAVNGVQNIGIGFEAGSALTSGSLNIYIGNNAVASESHTIRIGDGNQSRMFVAGVWGTNSGGQNAIPVYIDQNGQFGTFSSSRRYKDDIVDMDAASDGLARLRPVTFHYKSDHGHAGGRLQYGLVAEEVADVYPDLVAHSEDGQIESVMYQFLAPMLLNEYQKQQRTITAQAARVAELERDRLVQMARIDALEMQAADVAALKQQMAALIQLQHNPSQLVADQARVAAK